MNQRRISRQWRICDFREAEVALWDPFSSIFECGTRWKVHGLGFEGFWCAPEQAMSCKLSRLIVFFSDMSPKMAKASFKTTIYASTSSQSHLSHRFVVWWLWGSISAPRIERSANFGGVFLHAQLIRHLLFWCCCQKSTEALWASKLCKPEKRKIKSSLSV